MHLTQVVIVVLIFGYVLGSPPIKRTAPAVRSQGQSESQKHERMQTYLDFFYAAARIAGFTDDSVSPLYKGNILQ